MFPLKVRCVHPGPQIDALTSEENKMLELGMVYTASAERDSLFIKGYKVYYIDEVGEWCWTGYFVPVDDYNEAELTDEQQIEAERLDAEWSSIVNEYENSL